MNKVNAFAVYRLPETHVPHLLIQETTKIEEFDISNHQIKSGFVLMPFSADINKPNILINGEQTFHGDKDVFAQLDNIDIHGVIKKCPHEPNDNYHNTFKRFHQALNNGMFNKIVLSRSELYNVPNDYSLSKVFHKACKAYPRMMVYMAYTPITGLWMGCSPEIIISGKQQYWHTVALAGTQPLQEGRLPHLWNNKDKKEQRYVAEYIEEKLRNYAANIEEKGPYSQRAGQLAHLKSDFSFTLDGTDKALQLLSVLHPTPAVCGLPKQEAYEFINRMEEYDRRYYSGVIGPVSKDEAHLYVNLRCAELFNDKILLYAGGGLLEESEEESEYNEISAKMKTIKNLF